MSRTPTYEGFYHAIFSRLEPYFEKGTRELDWDVLPYSLEGLAKRAIHAETEVTKLQAKLLGARKALSTSTPNDVAFARKRDYDAMEERAETAEARVAELEQCLNYEQKDNCDLEEEFAELEAQNARLRAALDAVSKSDWWSGGMGTYCSKQKARLNKQIAAALAETKGTP